MAVVVLVGTVLWLTQNYHPRSFLGRGLLNSRLGILVLLVSSWGTAGSLIPYYVGNPGQKSSLTAIPGSKAGRGRGSRLAFKSGERSRSSYRASLV